MLSDTAAQADVRVLAATVAHEATHAWEHRQGLKLSDPAQCFEAELRAFRNQAAVWQKFHGPEGKPSPANDFERDQNLVLSLIGSDPEQLKSRLVNRYFDQCGYQGALPSLSPGPTRGAG